MLEVMNMLGVLPIKVLPNELLPVEGVLLVVVLPDIRMLPVELLAVDGVLLVELLPEEGVLHVE